MSKDFVLHLLSQVLQRDGETKLWRLGRPRPWEAGGGLETLEGSGMFFPESTAKGSSSKKRLPCTHYSIPPIHVKPTPALQK